jgi:hypothetical protein
VRIAQGLEFSERDRRNHARTMRPADRAGNARLGYPAMQPPSEGRDSAGESQHKPERFSSPLIRANDRE